MQIFHYHHQCLLSPKKLYNLISVLENYQSSWKDWEDANNFCSKKNYIISYLNLEYLHRDKEMEYIKRKQKITHVVIQWGRPGMDLQRQSPTPTGIPTPEFLKYGFLHVSWKQLVFSPCSSPVLTSSVLLLPLFLSNRIIYLDSFRFHRLSGTVLLIRHLWAFHVNSAVCSPTSVGY